jgi:hypothetical protein
MTVVMGADLVDQHTLLNQQLLKRDQFHYRLSLSKRPT